MKKVIFGVLLSIGGVFGYFYFDRKVDNLIKDYDTNVRQAKFEKETAEFIKTRVNDATNITDIEGLEVSYLPLLSKDQQDSIRNYLDLKKATILFNQGEDLLNKASALDEVLPMPNMPNAPKQLHPLTQESLDKALVLYEKARKIADKYSDGNDVTYNYKLDYLKGEIYFRYLEFLSTPDTNAELFNQTVLNYKLALKNKPGDIDTVINIEILIKNKDGLFSPGQTPAAKQKQMLNARVGIGHGSGN